MEAAIAETDGGAAGIDPRIERVASGDRKAAESLLRELLPRVRNLVRYLVRGDSTVDDLSQTAMIEILRALPSYRGEGSLEGFCDRICVRVTLAQVKRARAERRRRDDVAPELALATSRGSSVPAPDEYLSRRHVAGLLDALPDEQRQAVVLHHVLGLSVPEVAEQLGVPFDTAKSRLRLGLSKLRGAYGRVEDASRVEDATDVEGMDHG